MNLSKNFMLKYETKITFNIFKILFVSTILYIKKNF